MWIEVHGDKDGDTNSVFLNWGAVAKVPSSITICMHNLDLHVLGASAAPPCFAEQPWQLLIDSAKSLHGLPPTVASGPLHFLQNSAAILEGWSTSHE